MITALKALVLGTVAAVAVVAPVRHADIGRLCTSDGNGAWCAAPSGWYGDPIYITTASNTGRQVKYWTEAYCGGNRVTATCPFKDRALDRKLSGDWLGQIVWQRPTSVFHRPVGTNICAGTPEGSLPVASAGQQVCWDYWNPSANAGQARWTEYVHAGKTWVSVGATNSTPGGATTYMLCADPAQRQLILARKGSAANCDLGTDNPPAMAGKFH
jgi:hypothetical protein